MGTLDYLDRLAELVSATRFDALAPSAVSAAKRVVLDTAGAILAGSRLLENAALARLAAARSRGSAATLVGHGERADAIWAALANATAGVSLEMDEGNRWGGGHPAIHVLPAALALAEERGAPATALVESLIAGYEVTSRLGGATRPRANVHSHGTWGTIGAAVAAAKLAGLEAPAVRAIINLAASMSPANSWTPCFEGATVRNLYPGRSSLEGLLAVDAHRAGFTGLADGPSDVFGTILADEFDPARAVEDLGPAGVAAPGFTWRIERGYTKFHACCLYNHPALDAIAVLRRDTPFAAGAVAGITVTSIDFAAQMADPRPPNMLSAKFSIPYAVAAAVVLGRTDVPAFLDTARSDPAIRALAERVEIRTDPGMSLRRAGYPTATVCVRLADGRELRGATTLIHGDAEHPRSGDELTGKFLALAGPVLGAARAAAVAAAVDDLESVKDARDLGALLAV